MTEPTPTPKAKPERPKNRKGGRKPGSVNKVNADIRKAYELLLNKSIPKLNGWLNAVAKTDPAKALELHCKMSEYVIPKLARSEVTGAGGTPLVPQHSDRELARRIAFLLNSGLRAQEKPT